MAIHYEHFTTCSLGACCNGIIFLTSRITKWYAAVRYHGEVYITFVQDMVNIHQSLFCRPSRWRWSSLARIHIWDVLATVHVLLQGTMGTHKSHTDCHGNTSTMLSQHTSQRWSSAIPPLPKWGRERDRERCSNTVAPSPYLSGSHAAKRPSWH
jgi:hypothetical protein